MNNRALIEQLRVAETVVEAAREVNRVEIDEPSEDEVEAHEAWRKKALSAWRELQSALARYDLERP